MMIDSNGRVRRGALYLFICLWSRGNVCPRGNNRLP